MCKYITNSYEETLNIGKKFASQIKKGKIICFYGDIGVGKTVFIKGIAKGMGIKEDTIKSPTFNYFNIYDNKLIHIDAYRINNDEIFFATGIQEYLQLEDFIIVIEWATKIKKYIEKINYEIFIKSLGKNIREINIEKRKFN